MIKILHIMSGYGGGISSLVRNLIKSTDCNDIHIDLASFTSYPDFFIEETKAKRVNLYTLQRIRFATLSKCISEFIHILKEGHYDAIHIHITDILALYFSTIAKFYGIRRIIIHAHITNSLDNHGTVKHIKYALYRKITIFAGTEFCSCSKMASVFRFGKNKVIHNKVVHIPNSVDLEKFRDDLSEEDKRSLKNSLKISENTLIIGHVGYFGKQKNHEYMLDLIHEMKNRKLNFKWLFIGVGEYFEDIQNKAKIRQLDSHICFLGRRNDINNLFQIMDVSVLPSLFEGLPTVAIESQAAGTPIVMSTTITPEVDMGLGIVKFCPLSTNKDLWIDSILEMAKFKRISTKRRITTIKNKYFTSSGTAKVYSLFIHHKISHYNLGDPIYE